MNKLLDVALHLLTSCLNIILKDFVIVKNNISKHLRIHMKIICRRFDISTSFTFCAREICEMFLYKHSETIEYVKN